jgi:hypothetical protein
MTFRIGYDTPYTLANSRHTAPPKYVYICDENGIPRGIKSKPLTKTQMAQLEAYGKQVTRQNKDIERYMPNLKRIHTESLEKEIQCRRDINALRVATLRQPFPGYEVTDDLIRSFLMRKPKKPIKAKMSFGKRLNDGLRSFKIVAYGSKVRSLPHRYAIVKVKKGGRYISKTPMAAALKMHTRICRAEKISGFCWFKITLRETTKGSAKKEFSYIATQRRRPLGVKILKGRKVEYDTTIKATRIPWVDLDLENRENKRIRKIKKKK